MKVKLLLMTVLSWPILLLAQEGPNRPEPKPVTLDPKTTAILVLDLNARCHDPKQVCSKIVSPIGEFLERVRPTSVPIIYTVSANAKGKPVGEIADPLKRKKEEVVLYPDAWDKFATGELQSMLKEKGIKTLVIMGSSANIAVLYTASSAARNYRYNIVIPLDGTIAATPYEKEYTIHQFTVLASDADKLFQYTRMSMINFQ